MSNPDTFQPGDHVTIALTELAALAFNNNGGASFWKDQIIAHTRPGEATPQKQEGIKTDPLIKLSTQAKDFIARADLPGEGMKSAEAWATEIAHAWHGDFKHWAERLDALTAVVERIMADRGGPEPRPLRQLIAEGHKGAFWLWESELKEWRLSAEVPGSFDAGLWNDNLAIPIPKPADIK